jgi:hypothetical protein
LLALIGCKKENDLKPTSPLAPLQNKHYFIQSGIIDGEVMTVKKGTIVIDQHYQSPNIPDSIQVEVGDTVIMHDGYTGYHTIKLWQDKTKLVDTTIIQQYFALNYTVN